jgi:hypothetical protein
MKRSPFHKLIVSYYLKPMSARDVADAINAELKIKPDAVTRCTPELVLSCWREQYDAEYIWQELARRIGDRPLHGYPPSDYVRLAETLPPLEAA